MFQINTGPSLNHAVRRPSPLSWLNEHGFRRPDLALFGAEVRLVGRELQACHRNAAGQIVGWEAVTAEPHGRLRYRHNSGGTKCLFRSPPGGAHRLLVADGALPAIAAAACDRRWSTTCYAGVGGVWTAAAAAAVTALVMGGIARVLLGFANTPAGEQMTAAALADLQDLPVCIEVQPPNCKTWIATLKQQRSGLDPRPASPRVPRAVA